MDENSSFLLSCDADGDSNESLTTFLESIWCEVFGLISDIEKGFSYYYLLIDFFGGFIYLFFSLKFDGLYLF